MGTALKASVFLQMWVADEAWACLPTRMYAGKGGGCSRPPTSKTGRVNQASVAFFATLA